MKQFQATRAKTINVRQSYSPVTQSATVPVRQTTGNRALLALLNSGMVRAKLMVNQSGERYEREADRAAEQAMRHSGSGGGERKKLVGAGHLLSVSLPGLGIGRPLSRAVRGRFETAFGYDFSGVRIHTGPAAADAAKGIGAKAFTAGRNIVFGSRVDNPESGMHSLLLAHELAHVVQQGKGTASSVERSAESSLSAAPHGSVQAAPLVTAVAAPAEMGVGRSITATATVARGAGALTWTLVGAPAGVTITPQGRRATIRAAAAALAGAGANFTVRAARTLAAVDNASSPPIMLVGITGLTFAANPAFAPPVGMGVAPPANSADPNRDGLAGNTAAATVVTAPVARPAGTRLTLLVSRGAAVAGTIITPGTQTGNVRVRATDIATGTIRDETLVINPIPTRLRVIAQIGATANPYGVVNRWTFASSDTTGVLNRIVGETITAGGRDDFGLTPFINPPIGPNPAPILALAAPANTAQDTVGTRARVNAAGVLAAAGVAGDDTCVINVNRFVGPGVAAGLPRLWILRQGIHYLGWTGALWSNEIDHGIHRRSLVRTGPNSFGFRSEQIFPGAKAPMFPNPYSGPPLVVLSAITLNSAAAPSVPLATGGLAADGVAVAGVTVNVAGTSTAAAGATVVGRAVNWSVVNGPIAIAAPAAGVGAAVGGANTAAGTIQAGLVSGTFSVRAADTVFPNRRVDGRIRVVPVRLRGITAPVRTVPAGTLVAAVNVTADPGGRNVNWTVDPAAVAAGVTVAPVAVAGPAAAAPARSANVTRPGGFTGRVTVTATDTVRPAARASTVITFR